MPTDGSEPNVETTKKLRDGMASSEFEYDPSLFYQFSRDFFRIDVGLMIQRPSIFLHMREKDVNFLKDRQSMMEEYFCDTRQYIDEFNEVSKLNEDCLAQNPYASRMNMDNYPTHKFTDANGEEKTYHAASKQWKFVDPACKDKKSLHYAGEDRVFLIFKNKLTNEWEFPVSKMHVGQTFFRAKMSIFESLTQNKWRIKFFGSSPILHTLREFSDVEVEDRLNNGLKGVRTYWFGAHHWRGIPEINLNEEAATEAAISGVDTSMYSDWAWVPKRELPQYFTRDYHDVFKTVIKTR
jgi:hypothetical protein